MRKVVFLLVILVCSAATFAQEITQGSLFASDKKGKELGACPLKTTSVRADISGFLARVRVKQEFENSYAEAIEAVYTFPLSQKGAVDEMTMTVGDRIIRGKIMKREDARQIYEAAKTEGRTASLLDQERPNIFTQSVANIMPGEKVVVEISYVETLKYEDGSYEFVFPMVVAPRYIPGGVTEAAKIRPAVAATRPGHDVSIEVNLNAGVPVEEIKSTSHAIEKINFNPNTAKITLKDEKVIPNKDFVLRYDVSGKRIEDAVLAHRDERGGFFTMILQPPDKVGMEDRTPKEIVFVLDTSGSMSGFPIEKAKEAMKLSLDGLYPDDTFNLITFAGDTAILFDGPVPATRANLDRAQEFLAGRQSGGGTEMMKAIKASLEPSDAQDHLRIVCFMTDGMVGNDNEIIAEVQRHPKARIFSFGIGTSINRDLLEKIAQEGKGEATFIGQQDDGSKAARLFYERVRTPLLTDLSIDWNGMTVGDIYPNKLTDLFSAKPVIIHGRYDKSMAGTIKLKGFLAGQPYERSISIDLPESRAENDVLATLWARTQIDSLSGRALNPTSNEFADAAAQITDIGLKFGLMTQFTSFVAVEDRIVNSTGTPVRKEVPVAVPENNTGDGSVGNVFTSRQINQLPLQSRDSLSLLSLQPGSSGGGVNGARAQAANITLSGKDLNARPQRKSKTSGAGRGSGSGSGYGYGSGNGAAMVVNVTSEDSYTFQVDGSEIASAVKSPAKPAPKVVSGGVLNGRATSLPKPAYPAAAKSVRAGGAVSVQVTIDESGRVISAQPVSGNPLLKAAAKKAAEGATFAPTMLSGKPVKISGVITYNFVDQSPGASSQGAVVVDKMKVVPLSPGDKQRLQLAEKLHTWLFAIVERLGNPSAKAAENEVMFVHDGKADLRIELKFASTSAREQLKAAGFEIVSEKGKTILTGRIAIEKIAALAAIDEVKLVIPKI